MYQFNFMNKKITRMVFKQIFRVIPFLSIFLLSIILIAFMAQKISAKKEELHSKKIDGIQSAQPKKVITLEMIPHEIEEKIDLPGTVQPWISLEVMSQVNGTVVKKVVTQGKQVKKGDTLALIDTKDYEYAYASAKAAWESALKTEKRFRTLVEKNFVTQSQLDEAVMRLSTCRSEKDNAKLNLERCTISSPINGLVDRVHVENGKLLKTGDSVATIIQIDKVKIEVGIPESDVSAVRKIKTVNVSIDAINKSSFIGKYHYLHKTCNSAARLYSLEVSIDNPDFKILPDMFARVEIVKQRVEKGLAVPVYALITKTNTQGVFVEKDGKAQFREVTTGLQDGWQAQISTGLTPGDKVIVVGHRFVQHGDPLSVSQCFRSVKELSL